jgi:hypothetical protein
LACRWHGLYLIVGKVLFMRTGNSSRIVESSKGLKCPRVEANQAYCCCQVVPPHPCLAAAVQPARHCPVLLRPTSDACAQPLRRRPSVRCSDAFGVAVRGGLRVQGRACAAVVAEHFEPPMRTTKKIGRQPQDDDGYCASCRC